MGSTARYGLPYPELGEIPDVPADMQELANATDNALFNTGVPIGGASGQVLTKDSSADYDASWQPTATAVLWSDVGTSQNAGVSYGTSLPATPSNGQEAILVDNITNPTYQWRFRYNAGSSSPYKWEFVGGTNMRSFGAAQVSTGSTSYTIIDGTSPNLTAPRSGEYEVEFSTLNYNNGAGQANYLGLGIAGGVSYEVGAIGTANAWQTTSRTIFMAITAGQLVQLYYKVSSGTGTWLSRHLMLRPARVS